MHDSEHFITLVSTVVARYFHQNAQPPPSPAACREFGARLHALVISRGLPRILEPGEVGVPGGIPDAECAALIAQLLEPTAAPLFVDAARQIVKACFHPEFAVCRDSYRECSADGVCRRQQLARTRRRVSGAHCVDCPHWLALTPPAHLALLAGAWHGDSRELLAHRDVFLPEDFRALRQWVHVAARESHA